MTEPSFDVKVHLGLGDVAFQGFLLFIPEEILGIAFILPSSIGRLFFWFLSPIKVSFLWCLWLRFHFLSSCRLRYLSCREQGRWSGHYSSPGPVLSHQLHDKVIPRFFWSSLWTPGGVPKAKKEYSLLYLRLTAPLYSTLTRVWYFNICAL